MFSRNNFQVMIQISARKTIKKCRFYNHLSVPNFLLILLLAWRWGGGTEEEEEEEKEKIPLNPV